MATETETPRELYNQLAHDPRVESLVRVTRDFHKLILKDGFWIPPVTGVHGDANCRTAHTGLVEALIAKMERATFCYCERCRTRIVQSTLDNGKIPEYLNGWKPE